MQSLSLIVASNLAVSALLALSAVAVTRVWRNPHLAHALWLLVLLKLVTPPCVDIPLPQRWFAADRGAALMPLADEQPAGPGLEALPATTNSSDAAAVPEHEYAESRPVTGLDPEPIVPDERPRSTRLAPPLELAHRSHENDSGADPFRGAGAGTVRADALSETGNADVFQPADAAGERDVASSGEHVIPRASRLTAGESRWAALLLAAWAAGSLAWMGIAVRRCLRFRGIAARSLEVDAHLSTEAERLAGALGLRRAPPVRVVPARIPPLVWCCGLRPLVLLPRELLDGLGPSQRRAVLAHELAHVRRRDHLVRWLEVLVLAVFWWNPVAWYARRRLRQAEEECCDTWVVWALPADRRSYGQALLRTIEFLTECRPLPSVSGSPFGGFPFKRRIEMILKQSATPKMSRSAWGAMLVLAALVLPVTAQVASTTAPPSTAEAASESAAQAVPVPSTTQASPDEDSTSFSAGGLFGLPSADDSRSGGLGFPSADDSRSGGLGLPSADDSRASDPETDRDRLEARLERLERLVETLIADRRPRGATTPASPARASAFSARTYPDSSRRDSSLLAAAAARRVAVSGDGRLVAILTVGQDTSLIAMHDVESGQVLSLNSVAGRATEIRFTDDGRTVTVRVGDEWKSYAVPDGRELPNDVPRPLQGQPPAGVTHPPGSLPLTSDASSVSAERELLRTAIETASAKLSDFLTEWEPEERLLGIDVQQAELKLEAARAKLERLNALKENWAVGSDQLDEDRFAVRQAQLDLDRATTRLAIHRDKRKATETRLKRTIDRASKQLEQLRERPPAGSNTGRPMNSLDHGPANQEGRR